MPQDISQLESEVAESVTVMQSAKTLIDGFAARLAEAGVDPVKLEALRSDLDTNSTALAAAVAANTTAEGETGEDGETGGVVTGDEE